MAGVAKRVEMNDFGEAPNSVGAVGLFIRVLVSLGVGLMFR
jgi:hypothetical protein